MFSLIIINQFSGIRTTVSSESTEVTLGSFRERCQR